MDLTTVIIIILLFIIFVAVVFFIQNNAKKRETELEFINEDQKSQYEKLEIECQNLRNETIEYIRTNAELQAQLTAKNEQLINQQKELKDAREQLNKDFQVLANEILEEKTARFTTTNQKNIEAILKPLHERLAEFKTKVEETYDKESKQRFTLEERIKDLVALNSQISEDANNLTKALKGDNKIQGNWGEMILESILEKSGLKKGIEYETQETLRDENGSPIRNDQNQRMQPDVIINYPGGRRVIVDSKVSLNAYVRYVEANTDGQKDKAGKEHLISIKQHIDELSGKAYQDYIESVDFAMMFIPNEPAYILAMKLDANLWDYAYNKRILIINPTNLIASLRVVADLWKREAQSKHAQEIADRGAMLYDKFAGFVETLQDIGTNIERTQKSYDRAYSQLSEGKGNLLRQAEMLKELGINPKKNSPKGIKE